MHTTCTQVDYTVQNVMYVPTFVHTYVCIPEIFATYCITVDYPNVLYIT